MTSQEDVRTVGESIACYEKATGATLNVAKSRVLAEHIWDSACDIMGTPYSEEIKTFGVNIRNTLK